MITAKDSTKRKKSELKTLDLSESNINSILAQYAREEIDHTKRWMTIRSDYAHNLYSLPPNCLKILLCFQANVNRDTGERFETENGRTKFTRRTVWANLDKYYQEGWLAVARTQRSIGNELQIDQSQVNKALKQLLEHGYIKEIGQEPSPITHKELTVYAVGVHKTIMGKIVELFFYETAGKREKKKRAKTL